LTGERLYPINEHNKFGFINFKGKLIIEPKFECIKEFVNEVAWVNKGGVPTTYDCKGGKWGTIDLKGDYLINPSLNLSYIQSYSEELAWIKCGNNQYKEKWSIIDKKGNYIVKDKYSFDQVYPFCNGAAIVRKNRKKGFVDTTGELIVEPKYESVLGFSHNRAWVNSGAKEDNDGFLRGGKYGIVDIKGNLIKNPQYNNVKNFHEGCAWVNKKSKNDKWALISLDGVKLLDYHYEKVFNFYNNHALVNDKYKKWIIIDKFGNINKKLTETIDDVVDFDGSFGIIVSDNRYGLINFYGNIILEPKYDKIKYSEKACWVKEKNIWKVFNNHSKKLIKPSISFDSVEPFIKNFARIWVKGNKWGLIDCDGKILAKPKYDWVGYPHHGLTWVNIGGKVGYSGIRGGKFGLIDSDGNFIVEPIFDWIYDFWNGKLLEFKLNKKKGYVNRKGKIIWKEL
jgi:hypothetical protein